MRQAYIKTFGCQMNEQDSLQMMALLLKQGFQPTEQIEQADLILLNTCSIRAKAEHKIYSELGRIRLLKEAHPHLIVGVTGCVAEQEKKRLAQRFPVIDLILGPDQICHLSAIVSELVSAEVLPEKKQVFEKTGFVSQEDYKFLKVLPYTEENTVTAYVNIQKGCDNYCAYCIVPYVRGREVSRPYQDIIEEIQQLTDLGVKEVTLLGQNVNSYGMKDNLGMSFPDLLALIAQKTKLSRLRFATSHPKDVSEALVEQFVTNPLLQPSFHLPLQSGSDRVLQLMNRHYTQKHYLKLVETLYKKIPHMHFSTDIIVGFPTEAQEDFLATLAVMDAVKYHQIFSFVYSPRPNTKASSIKDDILLKTKQERLQILQEKDNAIARDLSLQMVGTQSRILVETVDQNAPYPYKGRTPGHKVVHFSSEKKLVPGDLVTVQIIQANPHSLFGNVCGNT